MDAMKYKVLMFPWLAEGHITPFFELAKKLIKTNFHVYIYSTQVNINPLKLSLQEECSKSIQFVELHLPSLPDLPPNYHSTKNLPPHLMNTLINAQDMGKDHFYQTLDTLKPDLVIYDYMQPWAPQIASSLNIPAVHFLSSSAAMFCFFIFLFRKPGEAFPFPEINPRFKIPPRICEQSEPSSGDMLRPFHSVERSSDVILINSFSNIEAKHIELFGDLTNKKVIPVGPLVRGPNPSKDGNKTDVIVTQWIEKKEQASVLYASFGSECYLKNEEIQAVAKGLELSDVNFIWVIRFPAGAKLSLEEALPDGFLKRVGEKGLVLENWAPQARILAHPNTGGFLSHCGWNSLLESMYFGVPVVAFPMHLDQPVNARLVEENGFGMEVGRGENEKCQEEELARVIREVMVEKGGEAVRKEQKN